jgi:hypothetical protein
VVEEVAAAFPGRLSVLLGDGRALRFTAAFRVAAADEAAAAGFLASDFVVLLSVPNLVVAGRAVVRTAARSAGPLRTAQFREFLAHTVAIAFRS